MSDMKGLVYQNSYAAVPDGVQAMPRANRRGELIVPDWMTQVVIEGRVFHVSNPTKGTAVAMGGTSYSDTAPAFLVDVPLGYTIIPLEILLKQGGTVAGAVTTVLLTYDNKVRYTSGGTAQTIRPYRSDAPVATGCTAYSGASPITAAAVGISCTFWASLISPDVSPTADVNFPGFDNCVEWTARQFVPPVLVGPASLVIYAYAGTTQPSLFYSVKWLEVPSSQLT